MDDTAFDALTRVVGNDTGTRRALVQLLVGSAVGFVVPRLGWAGETEAKAKPKTRMPKHKRLRTDHHAAERPNQEASRTSSGDVRGEGKGSNKGKNGKGKGQHHKPPKDPTPSPVCDNGKARCPDGSCTPIGECCPGSRRCADGFCHQGCCEGERQCYGDGTCVAADACCPAEKPCAGGSCVPGDSCCPEQKTCGDGSCIKQDECCPDAVPPLCGGCEEAVCENGEQHCRYQQGCCPNVISMHCPSVPASMWPTRDGEEIPLPGGCCPLTNFIETPQHTYCAPPHGAGDWYRC